MRTALILVDLQNDFLHVPGLEPPAGQTLARVSVLLEGCRALGVPVIHVWTTVPRGGQAMPHWSRVGNRACMEGSWGHAVPDPVVPLDIEPVLHKTFFSAFTNPTLEPLLRRFDVERVCLAGVHLHGCVRTTAIDAYQAGYSVCIAEDATAGYDPLHSCQTRHYLAGRVAVFKETTEILAELRGGTAKIDFEGEASLPAAVVANEPVDSRLSPLPFITHWSPRATGTPLWRLPLSRAEQVAAAAAGAFRAQRVWRDVPTTERAVLLRRLVPLLAAGAESLVRQMAVEVGQPVRDGRAELVFAEELMEAALRSVRKDTPPDEAAPRWARRRPLGVVAVITPWNNPVAIPLGKILPALLHGNSVVWKPAPAAAAIALQLLPLLQAAGCPAGLVNMVLGGRETAEALMADPHVGGVTLTGSSAAGYGAQVICARRRIPLQAELGGNNGAVVWSDCDIGAAARQIASAAFGSAGQRCTANRRVIVERGVFEPFLGCLKEATALLEWGDPLLETTRVGPLVSAAAKERVAAAVERARAAGASVYSPHVENRLASALSDAGAYYPPTIVCSDDADNEIVQGETFGPVIVIQRAGNWEEALRLCNGVSQGLVAALFSDNPELQLSFLAEARAGILKFNTATAGAAADLPFGGWAGSGIGPPEHGPGDEEFYSRPQAVYFGRPTATTPPEAGPPV